MYRVTSQRVCQLLHEMGEAAKEMISHRYINQKEVTTLLSLSKQTLYTAVELNERLNCI